VQRARALQALEPQAQRAQQAQQAQQAQALQRVQPVRSVVFEVPAQWAPFARVRPQCRKRRGSRQLPAVPAANVFAT